MKKQIIIIALAMSSSLSFASNFNTDPAHDQDMNIKGAMCFSPNTDLLSTDFQRTADKYTVTMKMREKIEKVRGYKEYYFWLDVSHNTKKGYQPYLPYSVAWPDLYADYRIFYSIDANTGAYAVPAKEKITVQSCLETDCAKDYGMRYSQHVKVTANEDTVTFEWPVGLLPDLDKSAKIRVGYTTYYSLGPCNGEDDSPQWGSRAHVIDLPVTNPTPAPRAPKAD